MTQSEAAMSLRTITARRLAGVLAILLLISIGAGVVPQSADAKTTSAIASDEVVLILAPFFSWNDLSAAKTPHLWSAAESGLIANINARSQAGAGQSVLTERALTIGAGAPVTVDTAAYGAYQRDEYFQGNLVSTVTPVYLQAPLKENRIAYLGLPRTLRANSSNAYNALPGLLGSTITSAGGVTAAIGNSDIRGDTRGAAIERPTALIAMDSDGYVGYGDVSTRLLMTDVSAPYGERSDPAKLEKAMSDTQRAIADSGAKKSLVVIDPGELYRTRQILSEVDPQVADQQWQRALTGLDDCFAQAREIWPRATILVSSVATRDIERNTDSFGPLIVSAPGSGPGLLISASTHRDGLVTGLDLAPSILTMLGIRTPVQMIGSSVTVDNAAVAGAELTSRVSHLTRMNATAVAVESIRIPAINAFVAAIVLIIVLGAAFVFLADRLCPPRITRIGKRLTYALILFVISLPVANWLMFLFNRWPATPGAVLTQYLLTALGLWLVALALAWRGSRRLPLIALILITIAVIIVDQFLGAPASFTSIFGYSPIAAARFYGIGNEAAAILIGAVMVGSALLIDQYRDTRWIAYFKRYGIAALGLLAMIAAAAPVLGANAGVAIWATMGIILFWVLINARRFTGKTVLVMIGAAAAVVAVFIAVDLLLPGEGTHLGRLVIDTTKGGSGQFWIIVVRKIATNLRVFAYTNWAYIFIAVIVYLIIVSIRPTGDFAVMLKDNPAFHKAFLSVLITGVIAFCTEDSGIVLPSLMVIYLGASIVWLMLGAVKGATKEERAALRRAHLQREMDVLSDGAGERP